MTLLPIVARELRVTSRRGSTYWTRFTAGLLAIVVGSFAWAILFRQAPRETGLWLFVWLAVIAYIYSLIAGALSTADCVSEEKREGTLGLLFLTDLKSYDIVVGKLAASSISTIYGLLAIFPVMGVPLLLGGVAPAEFWRVVLVCGNNLFLSLTIGLLCSALCKDERKSIGLTLLVVILLTGGWPGLVALLVYAFDSSNPLRDFLREHPFALFSPSPAFACVCAFDEPYKDMLKRSQFNWFYVSLAFTNLVGWGALALTTIVLPRVWQDKAASRQALRRRERWKLWTHGPSDVRAAFRRRLLSINPFYWLASRDRFKVGLVWLWMGAGAALWMFGLIKARRDWLDETVYVWTALLAHSFFKCWLAMEASRRLGADRRSGALELLLSTPLSVNEILRGQWLALLRQFGAAVALVCAVDFLFLGLGMKHVYSEDGRGVWVALCLAGISIFVFDLITLALVAMWGSLRSLRSNQAGAGITAIVRVCIVPWFLFGAFGAFMAVLEEVFRIHPFSSSSSTPYILLGVWFLISVANDVLLATWSLNNLRTRFRTVAMERTQKRTGLWGKWRGRNVSGQ
jgi:ABC-type transport system involved in multi-copper enzyme maturation permease subunit